MHQIAWCFSALCNYIHSSMDGNTQMNLPCMFVSGIYVGLDPQRDKGGQKARGSIHIATWFASLKETVIRSRFVCKEVLRGFDDNLKVGDWDWTIFWGCCVADGRWHPPNFQEFGSTCLCPIMLVERTATGLGLVVEGGEGKEMEGMKRA